jgi:hypothetical protein
MQNEISEVSSRYSTYLRVRGGAKWSAFGQEWRFTQTIAEWCDQHIGHYSIVCFNPLDTVFNVYFDKPADAILFKLRWTPA